MDWISNSSTVIKHLPYLVLIERCGSAGQKVYLVSDVVHPSDRYMLISEIEKLAAEEIMKQASLLEYCF